MITRTQRSLITAIVVLVFLLQALWLWKHGCPVWVTALQAFVLGLNLSSWWRL